MSQCIMPSFVEISACRLFGVMILFETMVDYFQWDLWEQISAKIVIKTGEFPYKKIMSKMSSAKWRLIYSLFIVLKLLGYLGVSTVFYGHISHNLITFYRMNNFAPVHMIYYVILPIHYV